MLTAFKTMSASSDMHAATIKKAAEEISLGTSILQAFKDPPPSIDILLAEV